MNISPQRAYVLVELMDDEAPPTESGLVVIRAERQPSTTAVVCAVGPDVREVSVGERVVVSRLQGLDVDGKVLLPEAAVLAKVPA